MRILPKQIQPLAVGSFLGVAGSTVVARQRSEGPKVPVYGLGGPQLKQGVIGAALPIIGKGEEG